MRRRDRPFRSWESPHGFNSSLYIATGLEDLKDKGEKTGFDLLPIYVGFPKPFIVKNHNLA
jgi:hypothetical protein